MFKSFFTLALLLTFSAQAAETVMYTKVVILPVDISKTKLKLSRADYSSPVVKVLVPELAAETIMNHRNTSEGAPCMATYDTFSPEDVIQGNPSVENVKFTIKLIKHAYVDESKKECMVKLEETITAQIRGFHFSHDKIQNLPPRHLDDCE